MRPAPNLRWRRALRWQLGLAALSGLVSVAAGAFAAHGMAEGMPRELVRTASGYQMSHALACFACAAAMGWGASGARWAPPLFLAGTALFSGSLYALAFGAPRWIGAVTPLGGLLLMAGWAVLAVSAWRIGALAGPPPDTDRQIS
jgi:uncharacterized membrane protein YgdD (TMEM256/DUF423 family)